MKITLFGAQRYDRSFFDRVNRAHFADRRYEIDYRESLLTEATVALARTAAALTQEGSLVSVAGGGDTVAALAHAGAAQDFTYVSAAGGAFLEWMEGKRLPGVAALQR